MPKYIELTDDLVNKAKRASGTLNMYSIAIAQMFENIDQLPAADVAPVKHGRWEYKYRSGTVPKTGVVSSCCDLWNKRSTDYCPWCGAKMDLEPPAPPEPEPYGYILISVSDGYSPETEQFHTHEEARKVMMEELAKETFVDGSDREEHQWSEISKKETADITGITPGENIGWTHDGAYRDYRDGRFHSEWAIIAVERWPEEE